MVPNALDAALPPPSSPLPPCITRHPQSYSCTCPVWTTQIGTPLNLRSCPHLKEALGEEYESERLKWAASQLALPVELEKPRVIQRSSARKQKVLATPNKHKEPQLLTAQRLGETIGVEGYWLSEKLDGVRACYDPTLNLFISRLGMEFACPKWWMEGYPNDIMLDGELYMGRGKFQETTAVVRDEEHEGWKRVIFMVFDAPNIPGVFEERQKALRSLFDSYPPPHAVLVEHRQISGRNQIDEWLKYYESLGGEGIMLRKPKSYYIGKRSATLLKFKSFQDAEAVVEDHIPGKGKFLGMMGAMQCIMANGLSFKIGTGFTDTTRINPPKVGSIISYRFQELTPDGTPKFPAFVGERLDVTGPRDADIPMHRIRDDDE